MWIKTTKQFKQLIIQGERFLGLDLRYFSKNSFFLLLREVVTGLSGFSLTYVLARQFTKYTFGEYNLVFSLLGMLSIFSLPGMMDSILNSVARGFEKSFIEGTKLRFKTSFLALPFLITLIYFYLYHQQPTIALLLLLSIPLFPFFYSFKTHHVFLIAKEKFSKLFLISSFIALITNGLVIAVTLIFKKIYLAFLIFILGSSLLDLFFYFYIKKKIKTKAKSEPGMKRFGYFMSFISVVSLLVNNLEKVVLSFFSGFSSVAVFSIAGILPQFIERGLRSLEGVLIPKIIKQGRKGNQEAIKKHLSKTIFSSILIFFIIFLLVPFFISVFFGQKYQESIFFAKLLSLPLLFCLPNMLLSKIIIFQKRLKQTLFLSSFPAAIKMVLYLVLIPKLGILGLVLSLIISKFLNFLTVLYFSLVKRSWR